MFTLLKSAFISITPETHPFAKSLIYKSRTKIYRMLYALFSILALIPATIDYEEQYASNRTAENCASSSVTIAYQLASLLLSVLALAFVIPNLYYQKMWRNNLLQVNSELPGLKKTSLIEATVTSHRRWQLPEWITFNQVLDIIFILINPYPGVNVDLVVPQQINYETVNICYKLNEVFYVLMFTRVWILQRAVNSLGFYIGETAIRQGMRYGVTVNNRFA